DDVIVLDSLWRGHAGAVPRDVELVSADLRDRDAVCAALSSARPDAVMHFAAATIVPESVELPALYFGVNTVGTHNLLDAMLSAGSDRFGFSSSAAVYGSPDEVPIGEESALQPINPYGMSKLRVERMLPAYDAAYGLRSVRVRYFNVAGAT